MNYTLTDAVRWIMLSQYGTEMFMTVAEVHQEYLDYLLQDSLLHPESLASFLTLRLYGPFSIFDKNDMEIFGFLVIALTCVHHREYEKVKEKREASSVL